MNRKTTFLGRPVRTAQRMLRAASAIYPEIPPVLPDGIYGENTMRAVTAMQQLRSLPATGIIDLATWNELTALCAEAGDELDAPEPLCINLRPGQRIAPGEENLHLLLVTAMLCALRAVCDNVPPVEFGTWNTAGCAEALAWLQRLAGLPPTGALDRPTWRCLTGLYRLLTFDGSPT